MVWQNPSTAFFSDFQTAENQMYYFSIPVARLRNFIKTYLNYLFILSQNNSDNYYNYPNYTYYLLVCPFIP